MMILDTTKTTKPTRPHYTSSVRQVVPPKPCRGITPRRQGVTAPPTHPAHFLQDEATSLLWLAGAAPSGNPGTRRGGTRAGLPGFFRRHRTCHFRKHAASVPAELGGGIHKVSRNRSRTQVLLQAHVLHIYGSGMFGAFELLNRSSHLRACDPARGTRPRRVLPRLWWLESGGLHDRLSVCCDSVPQALRPKNRVPPLGAFRKLSKTLPPLATHKV